MRHENFGNFRQNRVLTEDEMRKIAPSIFAVTAHESRSERFRPIPTIECVRALMAEGFMPMHVRQSTTRDASKREFTKHLIRFRRLDDISKYQVGDTIAETILKNANDGSSAYLLLAGLFRITCLNGMYVKSSTLDELKVRHSGDVQSKVIEGTFRVINESVRALEAPRVWSQINLNREQQHAFAEAAHVLRFADPEGNVQTPIQPAQLLIPRRYEDNKPDVWHSFQRIQENSLKGGLSAMGRDANGRPRRSTTREIGGIDQDVRLNKALWVLAERMAGLASSQAIAA